VSQQQSEPYVLPGVARVRSGVLGIRDFRLLWTGQAVSAVGDQIFPIAVALKVVHAGGSPRDLGLVLVGRSLALVLFLLAGGVYADRLPRARIMIGADAVRVVAVLGLALAPAKVPLLVLTALTFVVGGGEAFFRPAYGAVLPSVVPEDRLPQANAMTSVSLKTALILGPALGGFVVAVAGTGWALGIDAATFLASMATLLRIAEPPRAPRTEQRSGVREALEGVAAVRARPWIAAVLGMATLHLMVAVAPLIVLEPFIARERFGGDAAFALMVVTFAGGGLIGALVAARWQPRRRGLYGLLGLLPFGALYVALAYSRSLALVVALNVVAGVGLEPFQIWWSSALQQEVPPALLARVISLDWLVSLGLMPLGLALTGPAVDAFGRTPVLLTGAVTLVVTTLGVLVVPGVVGFRTPTSSAPA
jgi:DHA3 family tetracycline resistance protein-like MFS transporter